MSRSVTVSVAGHRLAVRTSAKPSYVQELAAFVEGQIDEAKASGRVVTTQSLALLAAMNIADELFQLRADQQQLKRSVRERSQRILHLLEEEAQIQASVSHHRVDGTHHGDVKDSASAENSLRLSNP